MIVTSASTSSAYSGTVGALLHAAASRTNETRQALRAFMSPSLHQSSSCNETMEILHLQPILPGQPPRVAATNLGTNPRVTHDRSRIDETLSVAMLGDYSLQRTSPVLTSARTLRVRWSPTTKPTGVDFGRGCVGNEEVGAVHQLVAKMPEDRGGIVRTVCGPVFAPPRRLDPWPSGSILSRSWRDGRAHDRCARSPHSYQLLNHSRIHRPPTNDG